MEIFDNKVLNAAVVGWIIAQTIKVILGVIREKRFNFKWFIGSGGMPSSHVAGMMSLTTSVGYTCGFSSYQFAMAFVMTLIVMFDAQGVRRTVGRQAEILNKMLDDVSHNKSITDERLRELLGHSPIEVLAGAALGILIATIYFKF